jgi:hypothetical protein
VCLLWLGALECVHGCVHVWCPWCVVQSGISIKGRGGVVGGSGLGEAAPQLTGLKAAIIVGVCSFMVAPLAAAFLVREGI